MKPRSRRALPSILACLTVAPLVLASTGCAAFVDGLYGRRAHHATCECTREVECAARVVTDGPSPSTSSGPSAEPDRTYTPAAARAQKSRSYVPAAATPAPKQRDAPFVGLVKRL